MCAVNFSGCSFHLIFTKAYFGVTAVIFSHVCSLFLLTTQYLHLSFFNFPIITSSYTLQGLVLSLASINFKRINPALSSPLNPNFTLANNQVPFAYLSMARALGNT